MRKLHFMSTEDYSAILHMRSSGELAEERENKALLVFMDKLSAINKGKDRQLLWVIAGYAVPGLVLSLTNLNDPTEFFSSIIIPLLFMNVAAFQWGKYEFFSAAEARDYEFSLAAWQKEGKPSYGSYKSTKKPMG